MKKTTTLIAMLFIVLATMNSCIKEDNTSAIVNPLVEQLVGEWIVELPVEHLEYTGEENIDIPEDANMLTVIYHFFADGTAWKEIDIMKGDECIFQAPGRYDYEPYPYTIDAHGHIYINFPEGDANDHLLFDGQTLTLDDSDLPLTLQRATEAQSKKYASEADEIHGGSDEGSTVETGIEDSDANQESRARALEDITLE